MSLAANARLLEAPMSVDDPATAIKRLHTINEWKRTRAGQAVRAFKPLSEEHRRIVKVQCIDFIERGRLPPLTPTGCCVIASKKQKSKQAKNLSVREFY